jgi:hypothetical protein
MTPKEEYEQAMAEAMESEQREYNDVSEEYQRVALEFLAKYVGAKLSQTTIEAMKSECIQLARHLTHFAGVEYEVFLFLSDDTRTGSLSMGFRKKPFYEPEPELTLPRLQGFTRLLPVYPKPERQYDAEEEEL